ncbi:bifunctional diaminohydroxyphosphoribosylaminopyrimidine deaminase/5-amino-6-(5-phosphoribosylamino)uracil reductase RibD [Thermodesulfobacteriota bacterium]
MTDDIRFMRLALREARKGAGRTSPNPCVGAVIVKDGGVVARGYHRRAGTPHAEVNALDAAGLKAQGATIYVTLEPCNHTGRTPPCTQAILRSGIRRVVIGMPDPNPNVAGGGGDFLLSQGVAVTSGVLEMECRQINRPFIKHIETGMPWVILKAGCSLDGRIAVGSGRSAWITNDQSRGEVHRMRDRVDAILVGIGTALNDNPSLTTRLGSRRGKDPLRVVLDTNLRLRPDAQMLVQDSAAPTWIYCGVSHSSERRQELENTGAIVHSLPLGPEGGIDIRRVLNHLGKSQINSLLVEGGSRIHGSMLREGLVDQVSLFLAPFFIGAEGIPLAGPMDVDDVRDAIRFQTTRTRRFGDDVYIEALVARD